MGDMRNPFYHRQAITDVSHFFGRGELVRSLLEMVASGQSCAVIGERRIGKSSLFTYLGNSRIQTLYGLEPRQILSVVLDFLALHTCTPGQLWVEILEAIEPLVFDPESQQAVAGALKHEEVSFADLRRAIRRLNRSGLRLLLLCDEFELAVQNPAFDESFFGALRSLAGSGGVVYVTASRLSLLELDQYRGEKVRQKVLGSPFFNIFAEFSAGPLADFEVAEMVAGLLDPTPVRFSRDQVRFLTRVAGCHPYFLQLAAYHLYKQAEHSRHRGPAHDITEVEERIRQEAAKIFRNQWQHSSQEERQALLVLTGFDQASRVGRRAVARLLQRGLVCCTAEVATMAAPHHQLSKTELASYRVFSDLFAEWITGLQSPWAPDEGPPANAEVIPAPVPAALPEPIPAGPSPERYSFIEEVGQGGTGTIFKAWDENLQRVVAIKVLNEMVRASRPWLQQLLQEARSGAGLNHPNIVIIHDIDIASGFLVEEFLSGGSLRDHLTTASILSTADTLSLAEQVSDALRAAHGAGIVHRDIKPENILLTAQALSPGSSSRPTLPAVKLCDFGCALRLDDLNQVRSRRSPAGSLAYMAPEQLAGSDTGPATDFYALGVVLFEARHGKRPAPSSKASCAVDAPPLARAAAMLEAIIARCLAPEPGQRFASADELLSALHRAALVVPAPSC